MQVCVENEKWNEENRSDYKLGVIIMIYHLFILLELRC